MSGAKPRRACFLGNSHTFYHAYAYQVRFLVETALGAGALEVEAHAAGGRGLDWHRQEQASVHAVQLKAWDDLVLQHVAHPWPGEEVLDAACAWWAPAARPTVVRTWLAMTWPERARPDDAPMRAAVFRRVAATHGLRLLPIADAWMAVRRLHPRLELYADDGEHASPLGAYLSACTAVAALCGIDPRGLPARVVVHGTVLADLAGEDAAALQAAAAATVA